MKFSKMFLFFELDNITLLLAYKLRFYILIIYYFILEQAEANRTLLNGIY